MAPKKRINLASLQHNLSQVRTLAPHSKVMVVVKANAYGHGIERVAKTLASADAFGVARTHEAITLRKAGVTNRIVLLEGVANAQELESAAEYKLEPVVHDRYRLQLMRDYSGNATFNVWLKFNCGMNRLGFPMLDLPAVWQEACAVQCIAEKPIVMSHLPNAHLVSDPHNQVAIDEFLKLTQAFEAERSIANSSAVLAFPKTHLEWVRPGKLIYGVSPLPDSVGSQFGLHPAMELRSSVIALHDIKAGDGVGYGHQWRASRNTRIAIVACGYGDGYPLVSSEACALIHGQLAPIVGRVSMDMLVLDVSAVREASMGSTVQLWGCDQIPVEKVASWSGRLSYELLCGVAPRVTVEESL